MPDPEEKCSVAHICTNAGTYLCPMCEAERRQRLLNEQIDRERDRRRRGVTPGKT